MTHEKLSQLSTS